MTARPPPGLPHLLLLLLLLSGPPPAPACAFRYSPVSSMFGLHIHNLAQYLLQDYPVSVVTNLQTDELCWELWHLSVAEDRLKHLERMSGPRLRELVHKVQAEVDFVNDCGFQRPQKCARFQQINISQFLGDVSQHLTSLRPKITSLNFSSCLELRCVPDPPTSAPSSGTPGPLGSQAPLSRGLLLTPLWLFLPGLTMGALWGLWRLWRMRSWRGQSQPCQGTSQIPTDSPLPRRPCL
ncbi:fms-related tyrosine kinase 3 ligand [Ornithorhynchus anatinus]|nr:fms-related tyrosine kinase 3 ligand [Ornithorhynchus anatinus]